MRRPVIRWCTSREEFLGHEEELLAAHDLRHEAALAGRTDLPGHCPVCLASTNFQVSTGAAFEGRPNLREGLVCRRCRLSARQRLVYLALRDSIGERPRHPGAILERHTRLFRALRTLDPAVRGSEFAGPGVPKGRLCMRLSPGRWPIPRLYRHESICGLSHADGSLGYLAHTDVLEHVEDTALALRETRRVLRPGAPAVFTVPFFSPLDDSLVRGRTREGVVEELLPAEYHDDGHGGRGAYTWYNFGWSFFAQLRQVFERVEIGVAYSPEHGLLASDARRAWWLMLPVVFRCSQPGAPQDASVA